MNFGPDLNQTPDQHPDPALEARLTQALEHPPTLHIPHGFAARVAALAPARPLAPATAPARIGKYAALAAIILLAITIIVLAPHAANAASLSFALELAFSAEFIALVLFLNRPARL